MFLTVTTIVINFILAFILLQADWTIANEFGILQWLPQIPLWLYVVIGLLLLDLIGRILYTLSNTKLNSCGDFILSIIQILGWTPHLQTGIILVKVLFGLHLPLWVLIVGSPMWMIFLYQTLSVIATQFNHANIALQKSGTLL
jgi:hypothetical protein